MRKEYTYLLAFVLIVFILYIFIFPIEFVKSCVFAWPLEPFNERDCLAEANYNTKEKTKEKIDYFFTSLLKMD